MNQACAEARSLREHEVRRQAGRAAARDDSFAGFLLHGYPHDYWRYEPGDIERVLGDFAIESLEEDSLSPGVFVLARKPEHWQPVELGDLALNWAPWRRRVRELRLHDRLSLRIVYWGVLSRALRGRVRRLRAGFSR